MSIQIVIRRHNRFISYHFFSVSRLAVRLVLRASVPSPFAAASVALATYLAGSDPNRSKQFEMFRRKNGQNKNN
jgi:hypothetical protein